MLFIDCYDSLSEAEKQAQLNCIDLSKLSFYAIQVNMSGTVFDTLCTEDVNRLADMYEKHKQQIISSYKKRKNKKMTFDMFVIGCLKKFESNLSIIRGIKDIKSDKHDIKFLSKRKIVVYNIIDEEVIVNCDMVTGW